MGLAALGLPRR